MSGLGGAEGDWWEFQKRLVEDMFPRLDAALNQAEYSREAREIFGEGQSGPSNPPPQGNIQAVAAPSTRQVHSTTQAVTAGPSTRQPRRIPLVDLTGPSTKQTQRVPVANPACLTGPAILQPQRTPKPQERPPMLRTIRAKPIPYAQAAVPTPQANPSNIDVVDLESSDDEEDKEQAENDRPGDESDDDSSWSDCSSVSAGSGIRLNMDSEPAVVGEIMRNLMFALGQSETGPLKLCHDIVAEDEDSDSDVDQHVGQRGDQGPFKIGDSDMVIVPEGCGSLRDYSEDDSDDEVAADLAIPQQQKIATRQRATVQAVQTSIASQQQLIKQVTMEAGSLIDSFMASVQELEDAGPVQDYWMDDDDNDGRSSTRVTSSPLPSTSVSMVLDQNRVPDIPPLDLPQSSDDLLLSQEHVVKSVAIYEPLRRFHQLARISPFRFEDFCAALACEDPSSLLVEVHIQLLNILIREDDVNKTVFGPNDVKESVQAIFYFVDHITWPETLRSYLESDPAWKVVYEAMISVEYPFCGPAVRVKVLGWLVDQFITTTAVRERLLEYGQIFHEKTCRACNRRGELIQCESCTAVYHVRCLIPPLNDPDDPPITWTCHACVQNLIPDVTYCISEDEKLGLLLRHEKLGHDRHGRNYWFLVRRILVESEDGSEVWYYSTPRQVEDLLSRLDAANHESTLVSSIKSVEEDIYRHMKVTEEVTRVQNVKHQRTYLHVENENCMDGDGSEVTSPPGLGLFKLGQENQFKAYVNHFIADPLALSKAKQNEGIERKRYMSNKFSVTTAAYGTKDMLGGTKQMQIRTLRGALTHMENRLPTSLMHVNWPMQRKNWLTNLQSATTAQDFSRAMLMISTCIRNAAYNLVWSESAGHVRFHRKNLLENEEGEKLWKRNEVDEEEEEDSLKRDIQFIKTPAPIKHKVHKQKGEEYRLHGKWGWTWQSNMRSRQLQVSAVIRQNKEEEVDGSTESPPEASVPKIRNKPKASSSQTRTSSAVSKNKVDGAKGHKFRTELVNVSQGLSSSDRILYPKVARGCDYLDSLLHQRLTLMSLEEKHLKKMYSDELVNKAKTGLIIHKEDEKKWRDEAEEYPDEEVFNENSTLSGTFGFSCYSSECRKEAQEFMKTKGKNRARAHERICYSPLCRLKIFWQEVPILKKERMRQFGDSLYKIYEEIEGKRHYSREDTSYQLYLKKLPASRVTTTPLSTASLVKYPPLSTFCYASSRKQSILVPPQLELKRLARTGGQQFTPVGFFSTLKSGSWGWSLPVGRPVFKTAWQYKTTHARTLATAAIQLRILHASIRWNDVLAKIPSNKAKHQVHEDNEIIAEEILSHRIVGRFNERVQYLRRMQVMPVDAPKATREITPARISLRKRKRTEPPAKIEPVVSEEWVDEEKLELWQIRCYWDRENRKRPGTVSDCSSPRKSIKSGMPKPTTKSYN